MRIFLALAPWLFIMGTTQLTEVFQKFDRQIIIFTSSILLLVFVAYAVSLACFPSGVKVSGLRQISVLKIFYFWLGLSFFEIAYAQGFPVLWMLLGSSKNYVQFGIPGLHGLLNGVWLALVILALFEKRQRLFIFLMLCQVLFFHRWSLTLGVSCWIFYTLVYDKRSLVRPFIIFCFFVVIFAMIGNLRSSYDISSAIGANETTFFEKLFLWVAFYILSPLGNFLANAKPLYIEGNAFPSNSLGSLLPSIFRAHGAGDFNSYLGKLVHSTFNVGSGFQTWFFDWGWFGVYFVPFFYHFLYFSISQRSNPELSTLFFAAISIFFFADFFSQLPFVVALILISLRKKGLQ